MKHVLILYDDAPLDRRGRMHACMLARLLRASADVRPTLEPAGAYRAGGHRAYARTFHLAGRWPRRPPDALVRDARAGAAVTWVGGRADAGPGPGRGIERRGRARVRGLEVEYRGATFRQGARARHRVHRVAVTGPEARVHAWMLFPDGVRWPYAVQVGSSWYVADDPFLFAGERDRHLVFADLLGLMLGDEAPAPPRALLRLEDLCMRMSADTLRMTLDVLERADIPFIMNVVPAHREGERSWSWDDSGDVVEQLRRGERLGGRVFQHGYTHQYGTLKNPSGVSLLDWEFWDHRRDRPIAGLREGDALERVERGRATLTDLGLSPVGWVTPHYMASRDCYEAFARVYPLACERRPCFAGRGHVSQTFPYPVRDGTGACILPENLGYVRGPESLEAIVELARLNLALRRPWASWYFHPYLLDAPAAGGGVSTDELARTIASMRALGYAFVDPLGVFDPDGGEGVVAGVAPRSGAAGDGSGARARARAAATGDRHEPHATDRVALRIRDADADARFRAIAGEMGQDADHLWVGGFVDFVARTHLPLYERLLPWIAGGQVLEVGFNVGATSIVLASLGGAVTAFDVDERWEPLARANAERYGVSERIRFLHVPDSRALPFDPGAFDVIVCSSVLEYVPAPLRRATMRALDRALRPAGLVVVEGTSNRLRPRELHSRRWLTNYVPRRLDPLLPWRDDPPPRGVAPWEVAVGFPGYRRFRPPSPRPPEPDRGTRAAARGTDRHVGAVAARGLDAIGAWRLTLRPGISLVLRKPG